MATILVIEDEHDLREEMVDLLLFEGFETLVAADGQDGIEVAFHHNPDLIISDVTMPNMDGYQVLEALQRDDSTAAIPFIFVTARAERSFLRHGMELGADDYLTKPFTHSELLSAVRSRLGKEQKRQASLNSNLERARRNLVQRIAQEMRTPLVSINTMQELIDRQLNHLEPDALRELLEIQRRGNQQLNHLVTQMVLVAELETGRLEDDVTPDQCARVRLNESITTSIDLARKYAYRQPEHPIVFTEFDTTSLFANARLLRHALAELVAVALDASAQDQPVVISQWTEAPSAYISVWSSGKEVSAELLSCWLNGRLDTSEDHLRENGTGLGLYLARRLVELHGGLLLVNTLNGQGVQFVIKLPVERG